MKKKIFNIIDIMIFICTVLGLIYVFYLFSQTINNYFVQKFIFPVVSIFILFVVGIKVGFMISRAQDDEYVGLIGKLQHRIIHRKFLPKNADRKEYLKELQKALEREKIEIEKEKIRLDKEKEKSKSDVDGVDCILDLSNSNKKKVKEEPIKDFEIKVKETKVEEDKETELEESPIEVTEYYIDKDSYY